jgi:hypothetical protein
MIQFNPDYGIGDTVYHRLSENKKGIIKDVIYTHKSRSIEYLVVFGVMPDEEILCDIVELSDTPSFG